MTLAPAPTALRPVQPDPPPARAPLTVVGGRRVDPAALRPVSAPHLRLLRHEPDPDGEQPAVPVPATGPPPAVPDDLHDTPDLRRRAHQVLCLVLEVLDGRRPLGHLVAHLEPSALRYVRAAAGRPTARPSARLTSLHLSRPSAGALEVAAVHRTGGRTRALAARFEGRPDEPARWRCVAVRLL
jgi:Family of unknown function (DUF6459)